MIEALEVFKVVAGIGVAGTGSYGVYYVINNNDLLSNSDSSTDSKNNNKISNDKELVMGGVNTSNLVQDKYYIAELKTASNDKPTKELYDTDKKNFKCTFTVEKEQKEDLNCDIFSVDESKDGKLLSLDDYKKTTKKPKKDELTTKTPPLLVKIKSSILDSVHWEKVEKIKLDSTDAGESSKNYGEFTPKYLISGGNPVGKSNLFVVWFSEHQEYDGHEDVTGKCSLGVKNTTNIPKDCELYKLEKQMDSSTTQKDIKFGEKVQTNEIKDFPLNNLYVLNLKEQFFNIKNTDTQQLIYYWEKDGTDNKKIKVSARFKPSFLLSSEETFNKNTSKPIILA